MKRNSDKDPKFKVREHVEILKYKNIFAKAYFPNWFEEVFMVKKVKNIVSLTYIISDLNREKNVGIFSEK